MKKKKNILLVTSAFYPDISPRSFRSTELAKEFSRMNHSVTVLTENRDYDYSEFIKKHKVNLKMWNRSMFIEIPQGKVFPISFLTRAIKRFLLLLFEYPSIEKMFQVKNSLKLIDGFDIMISFAVPYPVHWGVAWARSKRHSIGKIWIADCGDPYMGDVLDSYRKLFYFQYLEKWFSRKADYITIPVETARGGYYKEFQKKIRIIPQGFDFKIINNNEKSLKKNSSVMKFAYAGRFLKGIRDPHILMDILTGMKQSFCFYIFTNQLEAFKYYKNKLGEKLIISNYIKREELLKVLLEMDFLINFDNNTSLNIPSKLIDYAIVGKPVLNIDKNFKKAHLEAFLSGDYTHKMILPDVKNYHINTIANKFLNLLDE